MGNTNSGTHADNNQVSLAQFQVLRVIGRGAFGKVRMVEYNGDRKIYALKCISKRKCINMGAVHNILRERVMLELVDHPLVCNMKFAFQDTDHVYMVMDLMMGGDLRFHISRDKQPDMAAIRFWIAELVCAVKYLHSRGIVHRDIKPDNILLDEQGHIHLSDFNIASYIPKGGVLTSRSGTSSYLAPEIYKETGYNEDVDWWSVGVTFYETVYGKRPWPRNVSESELQQRITTANIDYTDSEGRIIPAECISAIQSFLKVEPSQRFGHQLAGWHNLIQHPFFEGIDWHQLDAGLITPPFQPPPTVANLDAVHAIEELLFDTQRLDDLSKSHKEGGALDWLRGQKGPAEELSPEKYQKALEQLESRFRSFDYTIYEKYQGFLDPNRMTVGPPPDWVKPAYAGADDGTRLPLKPTQTQQQSLDRVECAPSELAVLDKTVHHHHKHNRSLRQSWPASHRQGQYQQESLADQWKKRGSVIAEQYLCGDGYRRNRADSEVLHGPEATRSKRNSSQSFQERRERDRRRSACLFTQEAHGSHVIASSE